MKNLLVPLFMVFLFLYGCADGEKISSPGTGQHCPTEGAFRGKFWDYYKRAISCAEGGFYEDAINDFKEAIRKREHDQWRTRTYGMHFISYFPHRELGIIYYKIKRYDDAIKELEVSLNATQSAKANYFLNKVRRESIAERQPDHRPPVVQIPSPLDGALTNQFQVPLSIIVEDDHFVSSVSVNNNPVLLELAKKMVVLEENIKVEAGTNVIEVVANDLAGNTSRQSVKIHVDRDGPIIGVVDEKVSGTKAVLSGFISDPSGLAHVSINGRQSNPSNVTKIPFEQTVALIGKDTKVLIEAQDILGNKTIGEFSTASMQTSNVFGNAHRNHLSFQDERQGKWGIFLVSSVKADNTPPIILLEGMSHSEVTYGEHIDITIKVIDDSKIVSARLNDQHLTSRPVKQILRRSGEKLRVGVNKFVLEAIDSAGNMASDRFIVERKIPKIRQTSERLYVGIRRPFEKVNATSPAASLAEKFFVQSLLEQKRFHVADVVKDVSADFDLILHGTFYEDQDGVTLLAEIKDGSTEDIVSSKDAFEKNNNLGAIKKLTKQLALKIKDDFPLVEGAVTRIIRAGERFVSDIGGRHKIKKGTKLIVFRQTVKRTDSRTGKFLERDFPILGEAKVKTFDNELSEAFFLEKANSPVSRGDGVITK